MKKNDILKEIVGNLKKLISFKTIKDNYSEFDKALSFVENELSNYYVKEYVINNSLIKNRGNNSITFLFC